MPPHCKAYQEAVAVYAQAAASAQRWSTENDHTYMVTLWVNRARRMGDWDNFGKLVCDGLNGILWGDDRQVRAGQVFLLDRKEICPSTLVLVERLSTETLTSED
jgi:Holliday junction resolvase RusA-like endonuclease